jgi:hypothetical protein
MIVLFAGSAAWIAASVHGGLAAEVVVAMDVVVADSFDDEESPQPARAVAPSTTTNTARAKRRRAPDCVVLVSVHS